MKSFLPLLFLLIIGFSPVVQAQSAEGTTGQGVEAEASSGDTAAAEATATAADDAEIMETETLNKAQLDRAQAEKQVDNPDDFPRRLNLARTMHNIRPAREQVNDAIDRVAATLATSQQQVFKDTMRRVLDYRTIENISINAMAETFSVEELEAMVAYYSTPEAQSISEKYAQYEQQVSPEIVRMIDKAMMRVKTGGTDE